MNKLLKGAIASAAGVALLLGGAGTFALWNTSASVAGGRVVAGNLSVVDHTAGTACAWEVNGAAVADIASFRAVPGDILTCTKTVNVTASGNDMVVTLGLATAGTTASSSAIADTTLASYLNLHTVLTATGTAITTAGTPPVYTITPGASGITDSAVIVTATITFPKSTTAGIENLAATGSATLSALTVTLTEN